MPREYVPSQDRKKPGPKPGSKHKNPLKPRLCGCGDKAMRMGDDWCARCGKRLPDWDVKPEPGLFDV